MPPFLKDDVLAFLAGFAFPDHEMRATALAISWAENVKSDVTLTHKNVNGSIDYGLWQINSVHGFPPAELLTSDGNAHAAAVVQAKQGWKAWTTYNDGRYLLFLGRARKAIQTPLTGTGEAPGKSIWDVIGGSVTGTARWVADSHNWIRVALGVTGAGLMVGGLLVVARPAINDVARTVGPIP